MLKIKFNFEVVRTQEKSEYNGFTNDPLFVTLCMNRTRRSPSTYKVCVFNNDYFPLATAFCSDKSAKITDATDCEGNKVSLLHFNVEGENCWFPGDYRMVVYQANTPLFAAGFTLSDDSQEPDSGRLIPLTKGNDEFIVARDLLCSNILSHLPQDTSRSEFKKNLSKAYVLNMQRKALQAAGVGPQEPSKSFTELCLSVGIEMTHAERRALSRNYVVQDIDNNALVAKGAAAFAVAWIDSPMLYKGKREMWDIKKMVSEGLSKLPEVFEGTVSIVLYNVKSFLYDSSGEELMADFTKRLNKREFANIHLIIADGQDDIEELFEEYEELSCDFPDENFLNVCRDISLNEYCTSMLSALKQQHFEITKDVMMRLSATIYEKWQQGKLDESNIDKVVSQTVARHGQRLLRLVTESLQKGDDCPESAIDEIENKRQLVFDDWKDPFETYAIKEEEEDDAELFSFDPDEPDEEEGDEPSAECDSLDKLNAMIGLGKVKAEINLALTMERFNSLRRKMKLVNEDSGTHHMLFMGNPGTGKTTVAKLVGQIYHNLGVLSKGHTVVTDRATLVGEYIGQSEQKVLSVIEEAKGGVLFIDEAYTLYTRDGDKDYGRNVIESLLTVLSTPNPDMIVIFAGYEDKIKQLFKMNPGLRDRFPISLHFDDYTESELLEIILSVCDRQHFCMKEDARAQLMGVISRVRSEKDENFSNARWATNFFEKGIKRAMAQRVMLSIPQNAQFMENPEPTIDDLTNILYEDILLAEQIYPTEQKQPAIGRRKIGFLR